MKKVAFLRMPSSKEIPGYISLGSNMGDPQANIEQALQAVRRMLCVDAVSPVYWTEPQDLRNQDWFANCVARIMVCSETDPEDLLASLSGVEKDLGRVRNRPSGPRIMDIDILLLGDLEWHSETLHIPHPRMCQRAFVLVPLMHLAPDLRIQGLRASQWLSRLAYSVAGDRIWQAQP